jgi:hypothetical protein
MKTIVVTLILASGAMLLSAQLVAASDAPPQTISVPHGEVERPDKLPHVAHVGMGENQPLP